MDRKRLTVILPWIIGGGFCLVEAMKLAFQFQASDKADPASGRTMATRFVPEMSSDWDYITEPQMVALCVVMVAVMLLIGVALTSKWWARVWDDNAPVDPATEPPSEPIAPPRPTPAGPKSFGKARR